MATSGTNSGLPDQLTTVLNPQSVDEKHAVEEILQCDQPTLASLLMMIDRDRRRPIIFVRPDEYDDKYE